MQMSKALKPNIIVNLIAPPPAEAFIEVFNYDLIYHIGSCQLYVVITVLSNSGVSLRTIRPCHGAENPIQYGDVTYSKCDRNTGQLWLDRKNWRRVATLELNVVLEP
jgi:hypothetical protein